MRFEEREADVDNAEELDKISPEFKNLTTYDKKKLLFKNRRRRRSSSYNSNNYNNSATVATGPAGNTAVVSNDNVTAVKRTDIPPGDEDLYVLKSEIVPPVCPACPKYCERQEPCPACPPCARCPEPAFECKKVPNYTSNNDRYLPKPILNDFSTFGS